MRAARQGGGVEARRHGRERGRVPGTQRRNSARRIELLRAWGATRWEAMRPGGGGALAGIRWCATGPQPGRVQGGGKGSKQVTGRGAAGGWGDDWRSWRDPGMLGQWPARQEGWAASGRRPQRKFLSADGSPARVGARLRMQTTQSKLVQAVGSQAAAGSRWAARRCQQADAVPCVCQRGKNGQEVGPQKGRRAVIQPAEKQCRGWVGGKTSGTRQQRYTAAGRRAGWGGRASMRG